MKSYPRIDEIRSSGWSGAEQAFEEAEEGETEPLSIHARPGRDES